MALLSFNTPFLLENRNIQVIGFRIRDGEKYPIAIPAPIETDETDAQPLRRSPRSSPQNVRNNNYIGKSNI